jgi:5-methylcytosine-specific restriction endonuclease McrA
VERDRRARFFRLHSARHYLECSERRFVRMAALQFEPAGARREAGRTPLVVVPGPLLVDDEGCRHVTWLRSCSGAIGSARTVQPRPRGRVRRSSGAFRPHNNRPRRGRDSSRPSSASPSGAATRGRCVDCRSLLDLDYVQIIPYSRGGSRWIKNVELRCAACRERRRHNIARDRSEPRPDRVGRLPALVLRLELSETAGQFVALARRLVHELLGLGELLSER